MYRPYDIKEKIIVRKERRLPTLGEVMVEKGQKVTPDTIIARGTVRNPEVIEIRAAQKLDVDPINLKALMLKGEGDVVKKDEVIAIKRSFFGKSTRVLRSPTDGTIEVFSKTSGRLLIRGAPIPLEVKAHIPGEVKEIIPNQGATIECKASIVKGVFGIGGEAEGELVLATSGRDEILTNNSLDSTLEGKVIVGGSIASLEALRKAASLRAKGLVIGSVDEKDLTELLGYEIGLGVTGEEKIGCTIIITEGFGATPMNEKIYDFLTKHKGELVCIDGSTQIRTRMLLPEVIIPLNLF